MKNIKENQKNEKETGNDLKNGDYLNYLISLRNDFRSYHDHKEAMAWVALVVYLGTILTLFTTVLQYKPELDIILKDHHIKIFFIFIVVLMEILLGMFIAWEFWNRRIAIYLTASYTSIISKFLSGKITKTDFKNEEKLTFPYSKVYEYKTNYVVPKCIEEEYKRISKEGKLIVNEIIAYILILLSLFSLIAIMVKNLFY